MSGPSEDLVAVALRALVRQEVEKALQARQEAGPRPEGYLSTSEAARRAGVARDTVLAWIARPNGLPATRPQGVKGWKIRPADLEAFLAQGGGAEPLSLEEHRQAKASAMAAAALKFGRR